MKSFFLIKLKIKKLYRNSKIELYLRNLKVMFDSQKIWGKIQEKENRDILLILIIWYKNKINLKYIKF